MSVFEDRLLEQTRVYRDHYKKYGNSEKSILMPSDRRTIRYYELIKNFEFYQQLLYGKQEFFTLCDAGCGFGDLNAYLPAIGVKEYQYIGLDVVDEFLDAGREKYGSETRLYQKRNFVTEDLSDLEFDYAISSQTFNICFSEKNHNYDVIFPAIRKLFKQCKKGVSFNFFTDKVQFQKKGTAYHDPAKMLQFAYTLSNNIVLDNSCLPYECTLTILKDTGTRENGMIFDRFMRIHQKEFESGLFVVKKEQKSVF